MTPPLAVQVTPVLVVPLTLAVNCCVPPIGSEADCGEIATLTVVPDPFEVTVTVAEADFVASATLVALTVYVPAVVGATYSPVELMAPPLVVQATPVLVVPVTVA